MSFAGAADAPIEIIGGLVCDMAASELPPGVSPDCKDVIFAESSVRSRPGLGAPFVKLQSGFAFDSTVNYLKTFITASGTKRAMAMTDLANLFKETSPGAFTLLQQLDLNLGGNPYANSTTAFEKEYLAISDGQFGLGIPRQYDDTNLDRVSQVGPGIAPGAADDSVSYALAAVNSITPVVYGLGPTTSETGNIVTVQTNSGLPPTLAGQQVKLQGFAPAAYNGTFTVIESVGTTFTVLNATSGLAPGAGGTVDFGTYSVVTQSANTFTAGQKTSITGSSQASLNGTWLIYQVASNTNFFIYTGVFGGISANAGSAVIAGNISAGVHQLSVLFVTRSQFLTAPAPPAKWTATGNLRGVVSNIPVGPGNVIQRILCFTGAGGANFFYVTEANATLAGSDMVINDNVTTTVTIDFTDAVLLAGVNVDALFDQVELGECAGVIDYSDRLLWWGERNKVENFVNLTFDGGYIGNFATAGPLGWTVDPTFGAGGSLAGVPTWGFGWRIRGNSANPQGRISQPAAKDFRGVAILQPGTQYSVRFKVSAGGIIGSYLLTFRLTSPTIGLLASATAGWTVSSLQSEFIVNFNAAMPAVIPADTVLQFDSVQAGTPVADVTIDCVEIFPTNQPFNTDVVRCSGASNPESYDGVEGLLQPGVGNGQAVRAAFKLRERLYLVKEHSLYVTQDDASNEPSNWNISEVSAKVGTPSVRGVALGADWAVIADRAGLYITRGGEPVKISQEVGHSNAALTLAWDQINWAYGHTLWVVVDAVEKRILVGAPFNGATSPNAILMLDYRDIDTEQGIESSPAIRTSFQGKKIVGDKSRKWSPWSLSMNSCALIERADGSAHLWMGAGAGVPGADAAAIYDVQAANLTDYSTQAQIPAYYTTAFIPQRETNQMMQTHEHRKFFNYLTAFVEGAGFVNFTAYPNSLSFPQGLPSLVLASPTFYDLETPIDVSAERVAFKVSVSGAASWFRLQKLTPSMMGHPWAPVRGVN